LLMLMKRNLDRQACGTVDFFCQFMIYSELKFRNQIFFFTKHMRNFKQNLSISLL
jgi:hypothetical protein